MEWLFLTDISQLDAVRSLSFSENVVLFKHSARCSISLMVKSRLESSWAQNFPHIKIFYLDLLSHREISDEIARAFGIRHESPQILVIRNGICDFTLSHTDISVKNIAGNLN